MRSDSTNFSRLPDYVKRCLISIFKAAATTRESIDTSALISQHRKLSLLRSPSGRFLQVSYERQRIRVVRRQVLSDAKKLGKFEILEKSPNASETSRNYPVRKRTASSTTLELCRVADSFRLQ